MSDRAVSTDSTRTTARDLPTSQDLAHLRSTGKTISPRELKELTTRIKAFKEIVRLEDRLKALENRKRSSPHTHEPTISPHRQPEPQPLSEPEDTEPIRMSTEILDTDTDTDSDQVSRISSHHKRRRTTRGIKVTPSYTLRVNSSLREWGDWKRDMERVFEGDLSLY